MAEPIPFGALVFFGVWISLVFACAYTAFVNPRWLIKWFLIGRICRWFGVTVSIKNEEKFRRSMRVLGCFYMVIGFLALVLITIVTMANHG